jgi:hypothetical protein
MYIYVCAYLLIPRYVILLVNINVKVKVKVKLSLCFFLTEHYAMKVYWGTEI